MKKRNLNRLRLILQIIDADDALARKTFFGNRDDNAEIERRLLQAAYLLRGKKHAQDEWDGKTWQHEANFKTGDICPLCGNSDCD